MLMREICKAIFDVSKAKEVDLSVARSMLVNENEEVTSTEAEKAGKIIRENYEEVCKAYAEGTPEAWNETFDAIEKAMEEKAKRKAEAKLEEAETEEDTAPAETE